MYTKSKYVVGDLQGQRQAVVFPETIDHTQMRRLFDNIHSAGFCGFRNGEVHVYGDSFGLKMKSMPGDEVFVGRAVAHPDYVL